MNVNYHYDELISKIVMKFEETREQFIFQTISDFTSNVYQIEIDKQELIDERSTAVDGVGLKHVTDVVKIIDILKIVESNDDESDTAVDVNLGGYCE